MHQSIDKKKKIIIYFLLLFVLSTTSGKSIKNQNNYSSEINQINIEGLSKNENLKIFNELSNLFYKNILFDSKEEIEKIMSKYKIIEEYNIKIIYPSTIEIKIKPTNFIARLSGNNQLVGANGKLIEDKENTEILPYIFGKFDSYNFLNFKKNIKQSNFNFVEFKTLYFFSSNRWDVVTNDGILIK